MSVTTDRFYKILNVTDSVRYKVILQFHGGAYSGTEVELPDGALESFELDRTLRELPVGLQEADECKLEFDFNYLYNNEVYDFDDLRKYLVKGFVSSTPTTIAMGGSTSVSLIVPNHIMVLSNEENGGAETYDKMVFSGVQDINLEYELTNPSRIFECSYISDVKYALSRIKPNYIDLNISVDLTAKASNYNDANQSSFFAYLNYTSTVDSELRAVTSKNGNYQNAIQFVKVTFNELQTAIYAQASYILAALRKEATSNLTYRANTILRRGTGVYSGFGLDENYNATTSIGPDVSFIGLILRRKIGAISSAYFISNQSLLSPNNPKGFEQTFKTCWDLLNNLATNFYTKLIIEYDNNVDPYETGLHGHYCYKMLEGGLYAKNSIITLNNYDYYDTNKILKPKLYTRSTSLIENKVNFDGDFNTESSSFTSEEYYYESTPYNLNDENPENELFFDNSQMKTNAFALLYAFLVSEPKGFYFPSNNMLYEYRQFTDFAVINTYSNVYAFLKIHDYTRIYYTQVDYVESEDLTSPANYDPIPPHTSTPFAEVLSQLYNNWVDGRNSQSGLAYTIAKADVILFGNELRSRIELEAKEYSLRPSDLGRNIRFNSLSDLTGTDTFITESLTNDFILSSYNIKIQEGKCNISVELFGIGVTVNV